MPEGPEIKRVADRLARVLVDRVVDTVEFGLERLLPAVSWLEGSRVSAVSARGKAMLIGFDCGLTLYSHNQLYGRWYVNRRGRRPKTNRSLRVALHTATHSALLYSASDIEVLNHEELDRHGFLSRLGPDVLSEAVDRDAVIERLADSRFRNRAVSSLYLDQSFLAGLGNYLRSEILFFAGVHHRATPKSLTDARLDRLARNTLAIARRSYRTGGITNPPSRVAQLKAAGHTRARHRFAVFGRDGLSCYECGETILRVEACARRLYYCPSCQRR